MIIPVIMAGGAGSRLWPMSRSHFPKQFLQLYGHHTMLQETILRLAGFQSEPPIIITNEMHRFIVAEQLRSIKQLQHNIILEPIGKNTAPAIALAALTALVKNEDAVLLVLAADHVIEDTKAFHAVLHQALPLAKKGALITFGIIPTAAETGYGYIHRGLQNGSGYAVERFVEKPDIKLAQSYVDSGEYYWNSGMFMFTAKQYLAELAKYAPDILAVCQKALSIPAHDHDYDFIRVDVDIFSMCPDRSVDYAVMEQTDKALVIPLDAGWSDVGSWAALWDINHKDENNNVCVGDVYTHNTQNSYISTDEKLVTVIGVDNLVIVNTKDALLVASKDNVQSVKKVVDFLKNCKRKEYITHREVFRSWGKYDVIEEAKGFQINRVTIKPGGKFSLQMHHHRTEHWTILRGIAKVYLEGKEFLLSENQSTFIPIGKLHCLENPGKIPLEMIEVRSGNYLKEDDVIRIENML